MKKTIFLGILLLSTISLFAQSDEKKSKGDMPAKKNAVKLNISSLFYKNIAVQYERALAPKIAVACQLRVMPKGAPVFYNSLESQLQDGSNNAGSIGNIQVGSFAITPEFRFYPRHVLKGFYLAPYFRFRNVGLESTFSFVDSSNISRIGTFDGSLRSFAGGLMIGSHFNIGKSFSLDWFILGLHYSATNGTFEGTVSGPGMSTADQVKLKNDLQSNLDDTGIFKDNTVSVTSNSATVGTKFGFVGFRGFGLNFGYRF